MNIRMYIRMASSHLCKFHLLTPAYEIVANQIFMSVIQLLKTTTLQNILTLDWHRISDIIISRNGLLLSCFFQISKHTKM